MNEAPNITQLLKQVEQDDSDVSEQLLLLVYDELRKLASHRLHQESPGQTLQATALVHEAWLRLVDVEEAQHWDSRGHFFAAAAEAMRRILVDNVIRKKALKRGGDCQQVDIANVEPAVAPPRDDLLALNDALNRLAEVQPQTAELVKLRYFAGLTNQEAADALGISPRKATSLWSYARVWLHDSVTNQSNP